MDDFDSYADHLQQFVYHSSAFMKLLFAIATRIVREVEAYGLAMAVEMCNNNGHCRKFDAGTMCPSYRVTRDEQHLTRGRANTLRLRDRLVAYMPRYAPWASRLHHVFNAADRVPVLSPLIKRWLGFASQRSLPRFQKAFLSDRSVLQSATGHETEGREVVLFVDTFNNYMEPDNVRAAREVLQAAGYKVHAIESSCCGMAGSFGYEAEHYDVSMRMGELSLLPAVRQAPADAIIVADGTSCRHQIHDGAQRPALHVAQVLAQALNPRVS